MIVKKRPSEFSYYHLSRLLRSRPASGEHKNKNTFIAVAEHAIGGCGRAQSPLSLFHDRRPFAFCSVFFSLLPRFLIKAICLGSCDSIDTARRALRRGWNKVNARAACIKIALDKSKREWRERARARTKCFVRGSAGDYVIKTRFYREHSVKWPTMIKRRAEDENWQRVQTERQMGKESERERMKGRESKG